MACVESVGILCESLSPVLIRAGWAVSWTNYAPDNRTIFQYEHKCKNSTWLLCEILH